MDELNAEEPLGLNSNNPFTSVPIEIKVCVGKARPLVRDLVKLEEDAVLRLDKSVEDPVELYAGDRLIALGKLEEVEDSTDGKLIVRVTEIIDLQTHG